MRRLLLGAIALLLLAGPVAAQAGVPGAAEATVLQPGDAVKITVWRRPELSGEFAISADGTIAHPLFREVRVGGESLASAELRLREYLGRLETTPQFVVEPLLRVSVGGEVRQPNLLMVPPATTLAQAVALAGGTTERGRLDRVLLFRSGEQTVIDLTRPEAGAAQLPVRSGDQLFVQRRVSIFRDYIAPAGSITAALISLANILTR